jgi:hypothetical protein
VSEKGTLVEDKMRRFKGEYEHFSFNNCLIYCMYTHSSNSLEKDNSVFALDMKTGRLVPCAVKLKVHKIENFFDSDFRICAISLLVMHK